MAEQSVAFLDSLRKRGETETGFLRDAVRRFVHEVMVEVAGAIG